MGYLSILIGESRFFSIQENGKQLTNIENNPYLTNIYIVIC